MPFCIAISRRRRLRCCIAVVFSLLLLGISACAEDSSSAGGSDTTAGSAGAAALAVDSAVAPQSPSEPRRPGAEVATSVLLYSLADMEPIDGWVPCEVVVNRSLGFGTSRINFVITTFAVWSKTPSYYYKLHGSTLLPVNSTNIARFTNGLAHCFKAAVDAGFTSIHLIAHANFMDLVVGGKGLWRNIVPFNPGAKYNSSSSGSGGSSPQGYDYGDVLLQPAAEALNRVIGRDTTVEFAVAGEQGLSAWSYPREYSRLMAAAKATSSRNKNPAAHKYGLSFNYNKVCGCIEPEEKDALLYNATYMQRFARVAASGQLGRKIDVEGMKQLLQQSDFISLSAYAPLPALLSKAAMEIPIQTMAFELQAFGISLPSLLLKGNKPLIFSEQGLGGCGEGNKVAPSLDFVRTHPFWGTNDPVYRPDNDPWKVASFQQYRRELYRHLTDWAAGGGGPQYRIDGIFIWNSGSWDVQGVHPLSSTKNGTYADPVIANYIKTGNARARGTSKLGHGYGDSSSFGYGASS